MPRNDITAVEMLISEVTRGNIGGVKNALAAGVSVDGSRALAHTPLMIAVLYGLVSIAELLIQKGADLEICVLDEETRLSTRIRVVHLAAASGQLDAMRVILQAGANANSAGHEGSTPLMVASFAEPAPRLLVTRELLKAGADPAQPDDDGQLPLHSAARVGDVDLMDALLSHAPGTLNHVDFVGRTPLSVAAKKGRGGAVSYLLSAGASNRAAIAFAKEKDGVGSGDSPLVLAIAGGHEDVVRILLEDGLEAAGGLSMIPRAMVGAFYYKQPRLLRRLLDVEGEERRGYWARCLCNGLPALHFAASHGDPVGISILLAAGANETTLDSSGRLASDVLGLKYPGRERDKVKEAAAVRALERGPAFRAQSWAWPSRRDTGNAGRAAAVVAAADSSQAPRAPLDVRVFRPRDRKLIVKLVGRYAHKP